MIKGFILAAGFSKRLRPITEHIPKPLLPIAGEPLLDYVHNFLKSSGIEEIGINLHYGAEKIKGHIKDRKLNLEIFHEGEILDTGGALYNAKDFLKNAHFIVHNADIYWDGNIKDAINWHLSSENAVTLLVHDFPPENKLIIDIEGNLIGVKCSEALNRCLESSYLYAAFTGVALYSSVCLELLSSGPSSVIDLWIKAQEKGLKVKTFSVKYNFWHDIGTPIGYSRAVFEKLKRNFTSIYVDPTSFGCDLINPEGNVVIEKNVRIKSSFTGKNVIILPDTEVSLKDEKIVDLIIFKNFTVSISGWQKTGESLSMGGSKRRFLRKNNKVFCQWEEITQDFDKTIKVGKFFKQKGIPVADIIEADKDKKLIIFEDLGDLTLYSWLQCARKEREIFEVYSKVIENVAELHWRVSFEMSQLDMSLPEFDYEYFRWESDYFIKECVEEVFKINLSKMRSQLEDEFDTIADRLSRAKKVILHRDLQSQNIMLKHGEIFFIDYQSARWGPAGYDIASLLWDPYVKLSASIRDELVGFYINKASNINALNFKPELFKEELSLCRIQRHMQALGAYGFLSLKRQKKNFIKFIPPALELLLGDLEETPVEFKNLKGLLIRLKKLSDSSYFACV